MADQLTTPTDVGNDMPGGDMPGLDMPVGSAVHTMRPAPHDDGWINMDQIEQGVAQGAAQDSSNTDAPVASVAKFGPSEITTWVIALAGVLIAIKGKDFGLVKAAPPLGIVVSGLVVASMNISRAMKHRAAMSANAQTYGHAMAAQTAALAIQSAAPKTLPVLPTSVSLGSSTPSSTPVDSSGTTWTGGAVPAGTTWTRAMAQADAMPAGVNPGGV